jgi:hypothetical protein
MGDYSTETIKLQSRRHDDKLARDRLLGGQYIYLDEVSMRWIVNHIDWFISQRRDNKSIQKVKLYSYSLDGHDDNVWDEIGHAVVTQRRVLVTGPLALLALRFLVASKNGDA